jgi:hypothetical protein
MTQTPAASAAPPKPLEPTHPCVRCGRPVPLDVAMCETCNPLGLSQPATSQVHGTVFVAIVLAVVGLAVLGKLALSGVGPFSGEVTNVVATSSGLTVSMSIRNDGSKAGSSTCRLEPANGALSPSAIVQTPRIQPGESRAFTANVSQFGTSPLPLKVTCQGP